MPVSFPISEAKRRQLAERMERLRLVEEDLDERFVLGAGKGGQKQNKTSSCVQLLHRPSGIEVKCQRSRSQAMNRFLARRELCDRIEEKILGDESRRRQEAEKIRRKKRKRSRRAKARMLEDKSRRGEVKKLRSRPRGEE